MIALPASPGALAAANLAQTLPREVPVEVTRTWAIEDGKLVVRFMLKNKIRKAVEIGAQGIPMVFNNGIPGYVLPTDIEGRLFLDRTKRVSSMTVAPEGALSITEIPGTPGWAAYVVRGKHWGRSRLTITYQDGLVESVHYFVIKPELETVRDMGHFLLTKQWFCECPGPLSPQPFGHNL